MALPIAAPTAPAPMMAPDPSQAPLGAPPPAPAMDLAALLAMLAMLKKRPASHSRKRKGKH